MRRSIVTLILLALAGAAAVPAEAANEPFGDGTVFITSDLITPEDPTALVAFEAAGRGYRRVFDFRVGNGGKVVRRKVYLFKGTYVDGQVLSVRVNREFTAAAARRQARKYTRIIGQLPIGTRVGIVTMGINRGDDPPAANEDGEVTISTDGAVSYEDDGQLEEALAHESAHATLDELILHTDAWRAAQQADPTYLSSYARKYPDSEDLAESFVPWLIARYRPERVDPSVVQTIEQSIPNRLAILDQAGIDVTGWVR